MRHDRRSAMITDEFVVEKPSFVEIKLTGDNIILYDYLLEQRFVLSPIAYEMFLEFDGIKSIRDIAIIIAQEYIVIMYFDKEMVKKGTFKTIVQVKGRLGQRIPILTLMEEGTPQNIFSTLMAGAYDYLEIAKSSEEYRKKIEDIARWNWYLGKYGLKEK